MLWLVNSNYKIIQGHETTTDSDSQLAVDNLSENFLGAEQVPACLKPLNSEPCSLLLICRKVLLYHVICFILWFRQLLLYGQRLRFLVDHSYRSYRVDAVRHLLELFP